jgi:large subunit ribosomal protein L35
MPKLKTNKGAAKRFRRTASGGYKHRGANKNHILTKKPSKRKRQLRGLRGVSPSDVGGLDRMLPKKTR